jgi:hypothetical protein
MNFCDDLFCSVSATFLQSGFAIHLRPKYSVLVGPNLFLKPNLSDLAIAMILVYFIAK